ncbi:methyltransferase domain-containing protein [Streptomyces sp. NPDC004539]|uniref:methyltransferase domain-containing protein n=1 Tax=Streptomyces sp. NPDC004539 TaxID=3154280 RepID=UPI0033B0AC2C
MKNDRTVRVGCEEDVPGRLYGRLTDALLWTALQQSVFSRLPHPFTFVDASARAGRWARRIASEYPQSTGVHIAATPEAAREARARSDGAGYGRQVRHVAARPGELAGLLDDGGYDLVFHDCSLLNVCPQPESGLRELVRLVAPGGLMVSFLPSRWHTALEYLGCGDLQAALHSLAGHDPGGPGAPHAHLFTPGQIRLLCMALDLRLDTLTGFPGLVLPAAGSFYEQFPHQEATFANVLKMERELLIDPDSGARGANLLAVSSRPAGGG